MHNIYVDTTLSTRYPITLYLNRQKYTDTERFKLTTEEANKLADMLKAAILEVDLEKSKKDD